MTSLQWRFINHAEVGEGWEYDQTQISFAFEMTPRMSLNCKLVPVQNREYEYGHYQERYIISCLLGILLHLYSHIILFIFHLIITLSESRNVVAIYFFKFFQHLTSNFFAIFLTLNYMANLSFYVNKISLCT